MKIYAVRATKGEKNLYYILYMSDKADEDAIMLRMADLIEKSHKTEFDDISFWPLKKANEVLANNCPHVDNDDPNYFFPMRIDKEKWQYYVDILLDTPVQFPIERTVIV